MKHIKLYEGFVNEAKGNTFLIWKKLVNGWPEFTGCIIDNKFKVLEPIDIVFGKGGEYSQSTNDVIKKYSAKGPEIVVTAKDKKDFPTEEITPEEAAKRFKQDRDDVKKIKKFLTPEKTAEILAMFNKNEGIEVNEEATPEWNAIKDFIKKNNSWFDVEEEDDEQILLTTRENGNVGSETPGQKDKAEARRIFKLVSDKFPKQITGNLEEVDEFVYLYIKKAQSNLNK